MPEILKPFLAIKVSQNFSYSLNNYFFKFWLECKSVYINLSYIFLTLFRLSLEENIHTKYFYHDLNISAVGTESNVAATNTESLLATWNFTDTRYPFL